MKSETRIKCLVAVAALLMSMLSAFAIDQMQSDKLAAPESFSSIGDTTARSAAIFTELGKVLTHARCVNCHPAGDRPRQGDQRRLHQPPVTRGADGHGLETLRCPICHQKANFEPGRMPGHPEWHLAPREMAWEGKTVAEICVQINTLVGWAWEPGFGRQPAPGTQKHARALVEAWVKTGAACPN